MCTMVYILVMTECQFGRHLFRLVQEIRPDTDVLGITEYTHPLPPGVYAVTVGNQLQYIGECDNLAARFGPNGYGRISPGNIHDGRPTNCKINARFSICLIANAFQGDFCMSHHFDTKLAREDPSLNLCDFYLFDGPSGKTVMAMTVNPDVGLSAPDTLHPEGLYAFRFDLNGDAREEVTFKFRFGEPRHRDGSEHTHIQPFVVRRATGDDALRGDAGEILVEGETGSVETNSGVRAYVGIAPELFAANAGFGTFMTAFYKDKRYDGDAFLHQQNPFARRNVTAIVLEVPSELIGKGKIDAWATISLFGHAPEVQVSRWGLPMVTHLFLNDPSNQEVKEQFNASVPSRK